MEDSKRVEAIRLLNSRGEVRMILHHAKAEVGLPIEESQCRQFHVAAFCLWRNSPSSDNGSTSGASFSGYLVPASGGEMGGYIALFIMSHRLMFYVSVGRGDVTLCSFLPRCCVRLLPELRTMIGFIGDATT